MRGRKPKPAEQKRREGNPGKRPIGDPVIVGERIEAELVDSEGTDLEVIDAELVEFDDGSIDRLVLPPLPAHLALGDELDDTTEARDLWEEVCTLLIKSRMVVSGDLLVLTSLVESILLARQAWFEMRQSTLVVETANDRGGRASSKPSPWLKVRRDATAEILKIAEQYGLTPVARARLGLAVGAGRKLWEELEKDLPPNPLQRSDDDGTHEGTAIEIGGD